MLVNLTTGEILAQHVTRCESFGQRLRGLMFRRRLDPDEAYLFSCKSESIVEASIHMFFVFFPISVLWMDGEQVVVDKRLARPFRPLYAPQRAAAYFVEGAPQLLERAQVGDRIEFGRPGGG
jgi:uncharacterized membrane protein (UPF0127 family)